MPFSALGLSQTLSTPLAGLGFSQPTLVQTESIPLVLGGGDVLARAQTGTGKTAAFGLPMIERLMIRRQRAASVRGPRGLVLVPTRELAVQVHRALSDYGKPVHLSVTSLVGGVPMRPQVQALRRGIDILVATPGRLIDHMQQRTVNLSAVEILTLDEADRMLDMGFLPPLRRVLAALPSARQTLLFSATLPTAVVRLADEFTRQPVHVDASAGQIVAPTVTHRVHPVSDGRKRELLTHILTNSPSGQTLVFCRTKRGSDRVVEHLQRAGIRAAVIHGNKSQHARSRALSDFQGGRVTTLVATDVAARGLDIPRLPLVVNYDLPLVAEDYIHRVGRTGRAGLPGRAVSLVTGADRKLLPDIQRLLPVRLEEVGVEGFNATAVSPRPDAESFSHRPAGEARRGHGLRVPPSARYGRRPPHARLSRSTSSSSAGRRRRLES